MKLSVQFFTLLCVTLIGKGCCKMRLKPRHHRQKRYSPPIQTYAVGTLFSNDQKTSPAYASLQYSLVVEGRKTDNNFFLKAEKIHVDDISNSFQVTSAICELLSKGVIAIFGPIHANTVHTIQSLTKFHKIVYFTYSDPHHYASQSVGELQGFYIVKLRPNIAEAVVQYINSEEWNRVLYLYDSREALFRLRMIFEHSNNRHVGLSADARRLTDFQDSPGILQYINEHSKKYSRKYIILDLESRSSKNLIFEQIQALQQNRLDYHYLLIEVDYLEMNRTKLMNGGVNFTAFCPLDYKRPIVLRYLKNHWLKESRRASFKAWTDDEEPENMLPYSAALMVDGVKLLSRALRKTPPSSRHRPNVKAPCSPQLNPAYSASRLMPAITNVTFKGLSGNVAFNSNGFRTNYKIDIYEARVKQSFIPIGNWTSVGNLKISRPKNSTSVKNGTSLFRNRTVIVTSVLVPPFLWKEEVDGKTVFSGFCYDMMVEIARLVNFTFEFKVVSDGMYGGLKNGSWDGMIGELLNNRADLAVAPLTITSSRERVVDFSTPFMEVGLSVMFQRPEKPGYHWLSFMEPLSKEIWMCIAFAYLGVSVVLFLVSRFSPYEWGVHPHGAEEGTGKVSNEFSIFNSFWFSLSAFMQQGGDISPRSLSGRIVGGVWWFFTLIIISSYTANLAAYLTVERMSNPIQSFDDLAKQTKIKYGVLKSGSSREFFAMSSMDVFKKMWQFMDSNPDVFAEDIQEGYERVNNSNKDYAFLMESTMNEYFNQRWPCKTIKVGPNLDSGKGYGIATPPGSDLRDRINLAVLELKEKNKITNLSRYWWDEMGECQELMAKTDGKSVTQSSLGFLSVRGLFYLLIAGLCIGVSLSICEFFYKCILESRRKKRDFSEVFRELMYFSVHGKSQPVNPSGSSVPLKSRYIAAEKVEYSF